MLAISVKGDLETAARLKGAQSDLARALEAAVAKASIELHGELKSQLSSAGSSDPFLGRRGADPPRLGVRTGATRRRLSPGGRVYKIGNRYESAVGSPDPYMKTHESGGTIHGDPYLRIPLAAAQTPAGQDRNVGRSVRGDTDLFLLKARSGNLFLAKRSGRALELWYLLKRSVTMPARKMFATVTARMAPRVSKITNGVVEVVVKRANGR